MELDFLAFLGVVITLFLLMICGWIAARLNVIDDTASNRLSALIIKIGQPMMIISALVNAEFSWDNLKSGFWMVLIGFGLHIGMAAMAFICCKPFRDTDERKLTEFSLILTNCGFIGFPIMEALLGPTGLFLAAFYNISFQVTLWTWGIAILARGRDDIKLTVKKALLNLGTIPCLIGVALYVLNGAVLVPYVLPHINEAFPVLALTSAIPGFIKQFFSYLGGLCAPISLLITGALLAKRTPKQIFGSPKMYALLALKLFAFPLIVCLATHLLGLDKTNVLFCTAMAGLPTATSAVMMGTLYNINPGYAAQTVSISSLLSVVSLPVVLKVSDWIIHTLPQIF